MIFAGKIIDVNAEDNGFLKHEILNQFLNSISKILIKLASILAK
jgi:hypothetical protein